MRAVFVARGKAGGVAGVQSTTYTHIGRSIRLLSLFFSVYLSTRYPVSCHIDPICVSSTPTVVPAQAGEKDKGLEGVGEALATISPGPFLWMYPHESCHHGPPTSSLHTNITSTAIPVPTSRHRACREFAAQCQKFAVVAELTGYASRKLSPSTSSSAQPVVGANIFCLALAPRTPPGHPGKSILHSRFTPIGI